jgi:ribonuclease HI
LGADPYSLDSDDSSISEESDIYEAEDGAVLPLAERLRRAVVDARAKAGLASWGYKVAVEVFAQTLSRNLRRAARRKALPPERFPLRLQAIPAGAGGVGAWEAELCRSLGVVPEDFPVPPPPAEPPPKEEEAVAAGHMGPRSAAAWEAERRRQEEQPFVAGRAAVATAAWTHPVPPPPPGFVWCWGPSGATADTLPLEERRAWARLVAKEARSGALRAVPWTEVDLLTPAFIHWNGVKARLVHDLRAVNSRMGEFGGMVYEKALDALQYGASVAAKVDILSAFKHVRLQETEAKCMAFRLGDTVWKWTALPFGWTASPAIFSRALAPVWRKLRLEGFHIVVYVDDVLILAGSEEQLDAAVARLFQEMAAAGWYLALDKAFLTPCSVSVFLGRLVDLGEQTIRVSPSKAAKLARMCREALGGRYVGLNGLQRIGGLLAFFTEAVPEAGLMRTAINAATGEALRLPAGAVRTVGALRQELEGWITMAPLLTTVPPMPAGGEGRTVLVTDAAGAPYWGWGGLAWPGRAEAPDVDAELGRRGAFATEEGRQVGTARALYGGFTGAKRASSSTAIEIAACTAALRRLHAVDPGAVVDHCIMWYGDSQGAVQVLAKWRAKSEGVVGEVLELMALCRRLRCRVVPHWVSRWLAWQPAADFLSRRRWVRAQAEWAMPQEVYERVCTWAGWRPSIDMFATTASSHCEAAWTRFPEAGAATDAFARRWDDLRGWAFPPISMLPRVWQHWARARRARVLLVAPTTATVPVAVPAVRVMSLGNLRLVRGDGEVAEEPWHTALSVYDLRAVGS